MAYKDIVLKIKGTINNWLTEIDANSVIGSFQRSETTYTVSGSTYEINVPQNISKIKVNGTGTIISLKTNNRPLGTQFTIRFLSTVTVKHNAGSISTEYSAFSLKLQEDKEFKSGDILQVEMSGIDSTIAILEEVNTTSILSATSYQLCEEVTNTPYYIVKQEDVDRGYANAQLYLGGIAPKTHVFVWLNNVPLSIGSINENPLDGGGSVSYTETEQTVCINFTNTEDFGLNPYTVQVGWPIMIKYSRLTPTTIITPVISVTITSVVGTLTSASVGSFVITFNNTGAAQDFTVNYVLTDELSNVIQTDPVPETGVTNSIPASIIKTRVYPDLTAGKTYTLTATILANLDTENGSVTTEALAAIFQPVDELGNPTPFTDVLKGVRDSNTIKLTQRIKNIGNATGNFALYLKLYDTTAPTPLEISAKGDGYWPNATIAAGDTVIFERIISGTTNIEYNGYSQYDADIYLKNVLTNTFTII